MRSSKSRSRGKSNRNRSNNNTPGNNINRVFDSSGPEGKVRGTPQQIIDKYTQLARDAHLSNDRVATENFQQHAEHYTRLLGEATRDAETRRLQAEEQNRLRQQREREEREARDARHAEKREAQQQPAPQAQPQAAMDLADAPQPDAAAVIAPSDGDTDSGLVETPESKPKKRAPRPRKPRAPKAEKPAQEPSAPDSPDTPEAAE